MFKYFIMHALLISACTFVSASDAMCHQETVLRIPLINKYIVLIKNGRKTVEGRINKGIFNTLQSGSIVTFFSKTDYVTVKVDEMRRYNNFQEMLSTESLSKMLPGMDDITDVNRAVALYRSFPGYRAQEQVHGVVAVHLSLLQ